jgi:dihydrofolate synthase/folylpolyglutamate synthase
MKKTKIKTTHRQRMATRTIACSALLAAISIVMARFLSYAPFGSVRWSLDKFPLFLAGMLFGPVAGAMTGLVADAVGSMMQYGFNPILCPPAILFGLFGGLCRKYVGSKVSTFKLSLGYFVPVILGAWLYQSAALAYCFNSENFYVALGANLLSRGIQFLILAPLEIAIISLLMKTGIFTRMGLWPTVSQSKDHKITNAEEAVAYIHSVCWKGSIPGLGRTQNLLDLMGNPQDKLKYVHIAGTNGKGSTAAMTASILQKAGYRVGLYTSPYIYRFNERMQIDGEPISDEELTEITAWIKPKAQSMEECPTEFELVSCIAFEYFMRNRCDIVVLEVGMGGALDSTNVIKAPEVAVITNIGLDHTDVLGSTVEEIALTKSGIFKTGCDAVVYRGASSVEAVFEKVCGEKNISLTKADFEGLHLVSHGLRGQVFDCGGRKGLELPLLGDHQLHNAAVVLSVADRLIDRGWQITEENIRDGIREVSWPGRFDIMREDPLFIIDGGHNPQCIEALVKNIEDYLSGKNVVVLTGVLADKDYADMYKPVMPLVQEFVCITPPNPRKLDAQLLAQYLKDKGAVATACETMEDGVRTAMERAGKDGVVLSFGSLYSIGAIRDALEQVTKQ